MFCSQITISYLLVPLVIVLLVASISTDGINLSWFSASNREKVDICLSRLASVSNFEELSNFLGQIAQHITSKEITRKELGKCLGLKSDHTESIIAEFKILLEEAREGHSIYREFIDKTVALDRIFISRIKKKDNQSVKSIQLIDWWKNFVRNVTFHTRQALAEYLPRLEEIGDIKSALSDALNFAQNFNWITDNNNPLIKDPFDGIKLADEETKKSLKDLAALVNNSGQLEELAKMRQLLDHKPTSKNGPILNTGFSKLDRDRLKDLGNNCGSIIFYNDNDLEPLINLMKSGYYYELDENQKIEEQKYLSHWIPAIQSCQLLKYVRIIKLETANNPSLERTVMSPQDNYSIFKGNIPLIDLHPEVDRLNWLSQKEIDSKLEQMRESAILMSGSVMSKSFLQVVVSYVKSTEKE